MTPGEALKEKCNFLAVGAKGLPVAFLRVSGPVTGAGADDLHPPLLPHDAPARVAAPSAVMAPVQATRGHLCATDA